MKITKSFLKQIIKEELKKVEETGVQTTLTKPGQHISNQYVAMEPAKIADIILQRLESAQRPHSAVEDFIRFGAYKVLDEKTANKYSILENAQMVLEIYNGLKKKDPESYPEYMTTFKNAFQNFKNIFETIKGSEE